MTPSSRRFGITEAARAAGLSPDTIRYYERIGVLPAPPRTASGYRQYTKEHVDVLRFARRLRDFGLLPLSTIRILVRLMHDATCAELRDELLAQVRSTREEVARRGEELRRVEQDLLRIEDALERLPAGAARLQAISPCPCVRLLERER